MCVFLSIIHVLWSLLHSWTTPEPNRPHRAPGAPTRISRIAFAASSSPLLHFLRFQLKLFYHLYVDRDEIPIPLLNFNWVYGVCFHSQGPVFFYYGLSNYFQNYRKYGASKDADQLFGNLEYFKVQYYSVLTHTDSIFKYIDIGPIHTYTFTCSFPEPC